MTKTNKQTKMEANKVIAHRLNRYKITLNNFLNNI